MEIYVGQGSRENQLFVSTEERIKADLRRNTEARQTSAYSKSNALS